MPRNFFLNRTMCDVLAEMRECCKTLNFAPVPGLIEEVQSMANRMEAALADQKDIELMKDEWHRLKKKVKMLRKEKARLERELGKETKDDDD